MLNVVVLLLETAPFYVFWKGTELAMHPGLYGTDRALSQMSCRDIPYVSSIQLAKFEAPKMRVVCSHGDVFTQLQQ